MSTLIPLNSLSRRARRLAAAFGLAAVVAFSASGLSARGAQAQTFARTTVRNFCQLNSGLGHYYYGRSDGDIYAYWTLGTRYLQYIGFDTNGDRHLDVIGYVVYVNGQARIADIGECDPFNDWQSAAAIEQRFRQQQAADQAAGNEAWGEMEPGLAWSGEMNAMIDAFG